MEQFISNFNSISYTLFVLLYLYQFFYIFVSLFFRKKEEVRRNIPEEKKHRYAFMIAARNESSVIAPLIESIRKQNYPADLIQVFVVADNCTDDTAEVARGAGAVVYERFNQTAIGKGYALNYGFHQVFQDYGEKAFDGFFIFDADNLLSENYVKAMNSVFNKGYAAVTSYRNSKNYGTNWISAGYSLWFLRESRYLNDARMMLHTNCAVSGTGFLINTEVLLQNNGWNYTLLTEDIEFSVDCAIKGRKIGYARDAEFFDEQPETFHQSYKQRLRWAKGFYQVFANYGRRLIRNIFSCSFACYDLLMTIMPALIISIVCFGVNCGALIASALSPTDADTLMLSVILSFVLIFVRFYLTFFLVGLITTISEWNKIRCDDAKKIRYLFTFPLFMFTYLPIAVIALFKRVRWTPIEHKVTKKIGEI